MDLDLERVQHSRVSKSSVQRRTKEHDGIHSSDPPPNCSGFVTETLPSMRSHESSAGSSLSTPLPAPSSRRSYVSEVMFSFMYTSSFIKANITDFSSFAEPAEGIRAIFETSKELYEIGVREGWIACAGPECSCARKQSSSSEARTRREDLAQRKAILAEVTKSQPLRNGKLPPLNKILASYGRQEHPIGGQMAISNRLDESSMCEQCRTLKLDCIVVKRDRWWNRSQCVSCVQRKTSCSLDVMYKAGRSSDG